MRWLLKAPADNRPEMHLADFGQAAAPEICKAIADAGTSPDAIRTLLGLLEPVLTIDAEEALLALLTRIGLRDLPQCVTLLCRVGTAKGFNAIADQIAHAAGETAKQLQYGVWAATRYAITPGSASRSTRLFDTIAVKLPSSDRESRYAIACLIWLDEARALQEFDRSGYLTRDHKLLPNILDAIRSLHIVVPEPLLSRFKSWLGEELTDGRLLPALARSAPSEIEQICRARLRNADGSVDTSAALALSIASGAENPYERTSCIVHRRAADGTRGMHFDDLTAPQRVCYLAFRVDAEVCNGGFSQYFSNSSGVYSALAPEALETIGCPRRADMVRRSLSAVGVTAVRSDFDFIYARLRDPTVAAALRRLDAEYYNDANAKVREPVIALIEVYAADHREHFSGPWPKDGYIVG
jgi:hypothetical protein